MSRHDVSRDILWPALQVGGLSGMTGLTIGAFAGVLRSTTPTLFALASGVQWFTLGTTFWGSRAYLLSSWSSQQQQSLTSTQKIKASSIAGGIAGVSGGLLRSRRNILPGALMFSAFGALGQALYNTADEQKTFESQFPKEEKTLKDSWLNGKWSPMKVLSDEEYRSMLEDKLLRIEVQIGEVEESIEVVKRAEREGDVKIRDARESRR